jgi:hypothetical protein
MDQRSSFRLLLLLLLCLCHELLQITMTASCCRCKKTQVHIHGLWIHDAGGRDLEAVGSGRFLPKICAFVFAGQLRTLVIVVTNHELIFQSSQERQTESETQSLGSDSESDRIEQQRYRLDRVNSSRKNNNNLLFYGARCPDTISPIRALLRLLAGQCL